MKNDTAQKIVALDPWSGSRALYDPGSASHLPPGELPPAHWREITIEQRAQLAGLALVVLADHGPLNEPGRSGIGRLGYVTARLQEILRARTHADAARGGYGHDFSSYYVNDSAERKRWEAIEDIVQRFPGLCSDVLLGLGRQGDLRTTLLRRRDEIDATLERLAGAQRLFDAVAERASRDHETLERLRAKGAA